VILLIDNYDSFVHNLARYFMRLGQTTHVVRNDAVDLAGIRQLRPAAIVLSPGPCTPTEAGCSVDVIQAFGAELPTLGVCLGHQAIGVAYGGRVVRAERPMHGRTSLVRHRRSGLFRDIPSPLTACRYHSLVLDRASLPTCLDVTAWTDDGTVMGIAHREWPVFGVQFHPESILTEAGSELLANFLRRVRRG
jgi:anthranilate synthase/aminodeoxychorismate synthase-like glutamine amidotransferase